MFLFSQYFTIRFVYSRTTNSLTDWGRGRCGFRNFGVACDSEVNPLLCYEPTLRLSSTFSDLKTWCSSAGPYGVSNASVRIIGNGSHFQPNV